MVKHKRKGPEGTEKKAKKQKIRPAEETLRASEARPGQEAAASPEVNDSGRSSHTHGGAWCSLEQL